MNTDTVLDTGGAEALGLTRRQTLALSSVYGAVGARSAQETLGKARDGRGEIAVVRTTLDDRLPLDERLIFPVQVEPRLDRDGTVDAERLSAISRRPKLRTSPPAYHITRLGAEASSAAGSKRQSPSLLPAMWSAR